MKLTRQQILSYGPTLIEKSASYLDEHKKRNENTTHINYKIFYLLEKPFTFINAYAKISKNKGALTLATSDDENIMQLFSLQKAKKIAQDLRTNQYMWQPGRRTWIPKPGKTKLRPIDTPSQKDRLVQEAMRGILESIYEPEFRKFEEDNNYTCSNYGFRPNKSTWEAVQRIKQNCKRTHYVIEGDIKQAYNSINHKLLKLFIKRRIKDKKFLKLLNDLLKNGIMEKYTYKQNLTGTPQGGIVSPLLFNIYMFEFDRYINDTILKEYNIETKPKPNPEYKKSRRKMEKLIQLWKQSKKHKKAKEDYYVPFKKEEKKMLKIPYAKISTLPKHARYYRYADDWVLLLTCTKQEAIKIKSNLTQFLNTNLNLTLDQDKTQVSRLEDGFNYLGFTVKSSKPKSMKYKRIMRKTIKENKIIYTRYLMRTTSRKIKLTPDKKKILSNLIIQKFCRKKDQMPIAKKSWIILEPYELILKYRQIMIGLYNYYKNCDLLSAIHYAFYILKYSCAKTLARRKKKPLGYIFRTYGKNLTIKHKIQDKTITLPTLKDVIKKIKKNQFETNTNDLDPFYVKTFWRTKFKFFNECCICGNQKNIEMHHINSLQKIKKKDNYEFIRKAINRIQIPVCHKCHVDITNGKYSGKKPIQFYNEYLAKL